VHILGIAQSFALFLLVLVGTAAVLGLAVVGLARMERSLVPVRRQQPPRPGTRRPIPDSSPFRTDRVSSPGGCTFGPRR
jgi:hypothetical protein